MCGITGTFGFEDRKNADDMIAVMNDCIAHRGPDANGIWGNDLCVLGHRRLSIIDTSAAGNQPFLSQDGKLAMVFNGEIYNYIELAARLRQRGHVFRSHTDTEVIVHLYEDLGERCVHELNGMFSFILWDSRRGQFFGARFVYTGLVLQPCNQLGFIFFFDQLPNNGVLFSFVKTPPVRSKQILLAQNHAGDVAFELSAFAVF